MGHGGRRPGAGRKPGVATTKTREIAERALASGLTPLDYMLNVMRDEGAPPERRDSMAKAAAPYVHPSLKSVELTGKDGGPVQTEDVSGREQLLSRIAGVAARSGAERGNSKPH